MDSREVSAITVTAIASNATVARMRRRNCASVAGFARHPPGTACLQARLVPYNVSDGWLVAVFALDFDLWFNVYLPGLERLEDAIEVRIAEVRTIGDDLRVTLRIGS